MCYKCHFCGDISKPGQPLLKHITYKEVPSKPKVRRIVIGQDSRGKDQTRYVEDGTCRVGKDILSEVPVCKSCFHSLELGVTTTQLRHYLSRSIRNGYHSNDMEGTDSSSADRLTAKLTLIPKPVDVVTF